MTSKPASRRARATTFTPRSWPSNPTLAMRMRTGPRGAAPSVRSKDRVLNVGPEHAPQGVDDLPHRGVGFDRIDRGRDQVVVAAGHGGQLRQASCHPLGVAPPPDGGEPLLLPRFRTRVHFL